MGVTYLKCGYCDECYHECRFLHCSDENCYNGVIGHPENDNCICKSCYEEHKDELKYIIVTKNDKGRTLYFCNKRCHKDYLKDLKEEEEAKLKALESK